MKANLERENTTMAELWMDSGCLVGLREAAESAFWWRWRSEMLQPCIPLSPNMCDREVQFSVTNGAPTAS